jgi:hypothetical protein
VMAQDIRRLLTSKARVGDFHHQWGWSAGRGHLPPLLLRFKGCRHQGGKQKCCNGAFCEEARGKLC